MPGAIEGPWHVLSDRGLFQPSAVWSMLAWGVRLPPEVQHTKPVVREHDEDKENLKVAVDTVKKSMAAVWARSMVRNVRTARDGGFRGRGKYRATVDCATAVPNLGSFP